jgi:transposase-like protein
MAQQQTKRSRQEWEQIVAEYEESGDSLRGFAEAKGLNRRTLTWWRWRLRGAQPVPEPTPVTFAPVVVAGWDEPRSCVVGAVEATLPNGVTLRFEHQLGDGGLRELAEAFGLGSGR